jgi:hypothetical protein
MCKKSRPSIKKAVDTQRILMDVATWLIDTEHPQNKEYLERSLLENVDKKSEEKKIKKTIDKPDYAKIRNQRLTELDVFTEKISADFSSPKTRQSKNIELSDDFELPDFENYDDDAIDKIPEIFLKKKYKLAQTQMITLKTAEQMKRLVSREVVERYLVTPIETLFLRLLGDNCETLATLIPTLVKGGANNLEVKDAIYKNISSVIKSAKKDMKKFADTVEAD